MNLSISLALVLCVIVTGGLGQFWPGMGGGPAKPVKRNCIWREWKGNKCERIKRGFKITQRRKFIPAKNGGAPCIGIALKTIPCDAKEFRNSVAWDVVTAGATGATRGPNHGPSGRPVLTTAAGGGPAFKQILNPCSEPLRDSMGNILMLGKCETRQIRRRTREGLIEMYDEPLRETVVRSREKRQAVLSTKNRDILFLVDESGSVGSVGYKLEWKLVKTILNKLCGVIGVSTGATHVSAMTFNYNPTLHFNFHEYNDRTSINEHIDTISCANCIPSDDIGEKLKALRAEYEGDNISFLTFFIGNDNGCMEIMNNLSDGAQCYQVFRADSWADFSGIIDHIASQECMDAWTIGPSCS